MRQILARLVLLTAVLASGVVLAALLTSCGSGYGGGGGGGKSNTGNTGTGSGGGGY